MRDKSVSVWQWAAFVGLLALCLSGMAFGQAITGSITGIVQDPSGAAIITATVTLTEVETGVARKASTNDHGEFVFNGVPPGLYTAQIEANGFKTLQIPNINMTASEKLPLPPSVLEVGTTRDTVTVAADAAVVQTASGERSSVLNSAQMDQLMDNGRSALSIISILPGVVSAGGGYNISGLRISQINITTDGIDIVESGSEYQTNATFGMDAVAEIAVLTSNFQAEFGRKSGGSVQLVTKSGTKDFHGLFSYYKQNEEFNANTWGNNRVGTAKPVDRLNLYTFNIGGPLYIPHLFNRQRQKLFFFVNEEFRPTSGESALFQATVPTSLERAGNFSQSTLKPNDPLNGGAPFPNGIIPTDRIDSNGQALLNYEPAANFFNTAVSKGAYNYVNQLHTTAMSRLDLVKIDIPIDSADQLSVNYTGNSSTQSTPTFLGVSAGFPVVIGGLVSPRWFSSIREVHIFSPTLVNEITTGFTYGRTYDGTPPANRESILRTTNDFTLGQFYPASNPYDVLPGFSFGSAIPGSTGLTYDLRYPVNNGRRNLDFGDNLSKVWGAHSVKVGFYFQRIWVVEGEAALNFPGTFDFSVNTANPLNTANPYANALTGTFNEYQEASEKPNPIMLTNTIEWFAQDNWKVSRRFTLDYGVRFSIIQPWGEAANTMAEMVPGMYNPSQAVQLISPTLVSGVRMGISPVNGQIYPAALIGAIAPGVGNALNGVVFANGGTGYPKQFMNGNGVKLGPRFGFAYDVFGNGKTAIRGGFGIGYDRISDGLEGLNSTADQYPVFQTPAIYYGTMATLLAAKGYIFPASTVTMSKSGKVPAAYTSSIGIQQNVTHGILLDVAYNNSLGRNLYWQQNLASVPFGSDFLTQNQDPTKPGSPLAATFLQPFKGFGNVNMRDPGASSNYNALQVGLTRRFLRHLQFGGNWTWSKAMDYVDTDTSAVSTLINPRVYNYGLGSFDRTHVVNINWLYDLPIPTFQNKIAGAILNHWQVNGIAAFISGAPTTVTATTTTGADITGSPTDTLARANVTGDAVLPKSKQSVNEFFNTSVFQLPTVGTQGNSDKTEFRLPGTNNWNMSLLKQIVAFHERLHFEFRAEAYNLFNHTQYTTVNTTAIFNPSTGAQTSATFGQITAAASPRIMQLAVRFLF